MLFFGCCLRNILLDSMIAKRWWGSSVWIVRLWFHFIYVSEDKTCSLTIKHRNLNTVSLFAIPLYTKGVKFMIVFSIFCVPLASNSALLRDIAHLCTLYFWSVWFHSVKLMLYQNFELLNGNTRFLQDFVNQLNNTILYITFLDTKSTFTRILFICIRARYNKWT